MLTILKSLLYIKKAKKEKNEKNITKIQHKKCIWQICIYSMHFVGSETGFFFSKVRIKMDEHK